MSNKERIERIIKLKQLLKEFNDYVIEDARDTDGSFDDHSDLGFLEAEMKDFVQLYSS